MSRRSLRAAWRYLALGGAIDALLLLSGRPGGRVALGTLVATSLFFRDPERTVAAEAGTLYAPADGVVTDVADAIDEPWLDAPAAARISTFLSLHNVHVTRSPVAGRVALSEEIEGGLRPALLRASEDNRRTRLAIDGDAGRVVVVQIAGMVARRITSWVGARSTVDAGERIGLIHFGSRTDLLVPAGEVEVLVRRGDRVKAGVTPIARYRAREDLGTRGLAGRESSGGDRFETASAIPHQRGDVEDA